VVNVVDFVGRAAELGTLQRELRKVAGAVGGERPGRCVMLRGRRRVGKSRLVERFAERSGAPFLFYAATGASPRDDLARLARDAQASTLPLAGLVAAARPESWDAAFDVLAAALPADQASVLVIDEPVPVVTISRSGFDAPGVDAAYGPGDLLTAWPQ
jgi:AAA+ ATPase superfamily predicted ATPase